MNNTTYDDTKWTVQIALPGFMAVYFVIDAIWELPAPLTVIGVVAVIDLFLGFALYLANRRYMASDALYDGDIVVKSENDRTIFMLELNVGLEELEEKQSIIFKVVPEEES